MGFKVIFVDHPRQCPLMYIEWLSFGELRLVMNAVPVIRPLIPITLLCYKNKKEAFPEGCRGRPPGGCRRGVVYLEVVEVCRIHPGGLRPSGVYVAVVGCQ